jgi:hypothetical protein
MTIKSSRWVFDKYKNDTSQIFIAFDEILLIKNKYNIKLFYQVPIKGQII